MLRHHYHDAHTLMYPASHTYYLYAYSLPYNDYINISENKVIAIVANISDGITVNTKSRNIV